MVVMINTTMAPKPDTVPHGQMALEMRSLDKRLRIMEFAAIFGLGPFLLYWFRFSIAHKIVLIILAAAALSLTYLIKNRSFDRRILWQMDGQAVHLKKVLIFFLAPAAVLLVASYFWAAPHFLAFPRQKPVTWLLVMLLYPLLAAYPQEIFFRSFFFHRYRALFPNPTVMVLVNAVCFGSAHLLYGNWVAPVLSTAGGFLFAYRYIRSESLITVSLEHGLYGNYLFTIGIGWYFYSGYLQ